MTPLRGGHNYNVLANPLSGDVNLSPDNSQFLVEHLR